MKKNYLSTLLLVMLSCTMMMAMTQSVYDELIAKLRAPNLTDKERVDIYNKLSYESIRTDPDLIKMHADSALAIAQRINYAYGELEALKNSGNFYMKKGLHIDRAIVMYSAALEKAEELDLKFHISGLNNNLGLLYLQEGRYEQALYHLLIAKSVHSESIDTTTYLYGLIHTNISETYTELGELDEAKSHYAYLIDTLCTAPHMSKVKHMSIIGASYVDYLIDGDIKKAEKRIRENLLPLKELGDQESIIKSYNIITKMAMLEKDWETALRASNEIYDQENYANFTRENCIMLLNQAAIYGELKDYDKVIAAGVQARECSPIYSTIEHKISVAKELYQAYLGIGDNKKAEAELNVLSGYLDELMQEQKKDIKIETLRKYENDLREAENQMLVERENSQKLVVTYLASALIAFVLMTLLVGFFHFKKRVASKALRQQNKLLNEAQETLKQKNADLEKYIESNIQLEQFAHIASHDLKSPLRTIKSFIGLLQRGASEKLDLSENMYLSMVSDAADDMYALVTDLLAYSKANALNLTVSETSLRDIVGNVQRQLTQAIDEKEATISIHDLPVDYVQVDDVKMRQVFQNLIANALKFVPEGRAPHIDIGYTSTADMHRITISDNGIGIDPDYYEEVFTPFKRLNTKTEYAGTGLGLSLVQRIIEKHDGQIWIEANEPNGTKFIFEISKHLQPTEKPVMA